MVRDAGYRLVLAGLVTGVVDGLFACVLSVVFYDSTIARLFQGVASTVLGQASFTGGARTAFIGVLMHFAVAFFWSAVFLLLVLRSAGIRRVLASRAGALKIASFYGPLIWLVMSLAVIPLLLHRPPTMTTRWWIQLVGHIVFVGLPIVGSIGSGVRSSDAVGES